MALEGGLEQPAAALLSRRGCKIKTKCFHRIRQLGPRQQPWEAASVGQPREPRIWPVGLVAVQQPSVRPPHNPTLPQISRGAKRRGGRVIRQELQKVLEDAGREKGML